MDSPEAYGNAVTSYRRSDVGPLASRLERFGATILDALIFSTILNLLAPALWLGFARYPDTFEVLSTNSMLSSRIFEWLLSIVFFLLVQGYPLWATGQTWGKRSLGIKIVNINGEKPPFWRLIGLRYAFFYALAAIPYGQLAWIANVLLIFRRDQRCGHDLIAGTKVVGVK